MNRKPNTSCIVFQPIDLRKLGGALPSSLRGSMVSLLVLCLVMVLRSSEGLSSGGPSGVASRRGFVFGVSTASSFPLVAAKAQSSSQSSVVTTEKGVKYRVVKEGACPAADMLGLAGSCRPSTGSFCIIDYTGFLPSGKVFDSTESTGRKPLAFRLGTKQVNDGLEELLEYMKPGEEVQALVPSAVAFGAKGVCNDDGECLVPPNTDLKYFVRLIRVAKAAG